MRGAPEEEVAAGGMDRYEKLRELHRTLKPSLYLEIGVRTGTSLRLATCRAIGVDPAPRTKPTGLQSIYRMTSDKFFETVQLPVSPDLVYIDGLHLFEQVLRDFIHCERICSSSSHILIDDIYPAHPAQAERERRTCKWTGDVWKILPTLQQYRPDLTLKTFDVSPTGLLLVSDLNPESKVLSDHYDEIVQAFEGREVPVDILERKHAR